jgi:hypothetical protein
MRSVMRPSPIAVWLSVVFVLAGLPAQAADTGNGSKNFRTPATVPNYFSNEAGPMIGGAAESQRGPLYSGQTASSPPPPVREPAAVAAASVRERQHIAMAVPHGRAVRGRRGAPVVARHVAVHGRVLSRAEAHGVSRGHSVQAARATHTVTKTRVSNAHRHARG